MANYGKGTGWLAKHRLAKRRLLNKVTALLLVLGITAAGAGTAWKLKAAQALREVPESSVAEATPQPTAQPAEETAAPDRSLWNTGTPVAQTLDGAYYAPDWRMNALRESPAVDDSYFNTATFVGDSLTQGLSLYSTGLPNAHFCAYRSIGPNAIVQKATLTRSDGTKEIAIDALVASQPDYVYILLGTNTLVNLGNDDNFIAYYGAMLDMFKEALPAGVTYYVQAIPAVAADVYTQKAGLENNRIRAINSRLAQLALEKGCYFLDLQEALTGPDGNQIPEYAASDGIHYNPTGYQAWVDYLRTHTVYHRRNPYLAGNPYYIDPADPNGSAPIAEATPAPEAVPEPAPEPVPEPTAEPAGEAPAAP